MGAPHTSAPKGTISPRHALPKCSAHLDVAGPANVKLVVLHAAGTRLGVGAPFPHPSPQKRHENREIHREAENKPHENSSHLPLDRLLEHDPPVHPIDMDEILGGEMSGEDFLRQRVFDLLLDGSFQRARAVDRVEAFTRQFA